MLIVPLLLLRSVLVTSCSVQRLLMLPLHMLQLGDQNSPCEHSHHWNWKRQLLQVLAPSLPKARVSENIEEGHQGGNGAEDDDNGKGRGNKNSMF